MLRFYSLIIKRKFYDYLFFIKKNRKVSLKDEAKNERETLHEIFGKYENHYFKIEMQK
jgi:hypothetical protein